MPTISRVLDPQPIMNLADYLAGGGGKGLDAARRLGPVGTIEELTAAGLRGRGGAGFPTGRKWATVARYASDVVPSTVVVNASEGEPGSFKDRTLMRRNPFRILEGALIAAGAVGADSVVVAVKASFRTEMDRLRTAIAEIEAVGWAPGIALTVVEGPSEYLFGEETALLEAVNGRPPFPRVTPPWRHGVDEVGTDSADPADLVMAAPGAATPAPPALVNNAETLANVPGILASGAAWYRQVGTPGSPGTVVCTVSGSTRRSGVGEFPMGTPLSEVIETLGAGPAHEPIVAVLSGVANRFLPAGALDTPVSYEDMEAAGAGLGAAGFIVFDARDDVVAAAAGVSRFLAVESCGQCTPCKQDGLALAELLDVLRRGGDPEVPGASSAAPTVSSSGGLGGFLDQIAARAATVGDEARCGLAGQHQRIVQSLLELFPTAVRAAASGRAASGAILIAPIDDLIAGRAVLDEGHAGKQPDWTYDEVDSGQSPADRATEVLADRS